jgi:hypothetical protein
MACLRHGLPPDQGRGVDDLPENVKQGIANTSRKDSIPRS